MITLHLLRSRGRGFESLTQIISIEFENLNPASSQIGTSDCKIDHKTCFSLLWLDE